MKQCPLDQCDGSGFIPQYTRPEPNAPMVWDHDEECSCRELDEDNDNALFQALARKNRRIHELASTVKAYAVIIVILSIVIIIQMYGN